jgi:hypothetical protein
MLYLTDFSTASEAASHGLCYIWALGIADASNSQSHL